jgi:rubrerythrin
MLRFFNACAEIEETVGAIYRQLAAALPEGDELRSLWLQMAIEEDEHARQIRLAGRLPAREVFKGLHIPLAKIEEHLQRARAIQKKLQEVRPAMPVALKLSMQLEEEFRVVHVALAVEFRDESMKRMFESLAGDDDRHANQLRQFLAKMAVPAGQRGEGV